MTARIGALFSGAGMLDYAVEQVFGGEVVWHSEIDSAASKVLAYRFPDVPNLGSITDIDFTQVEPVDILCGGFPCQDLSAAGKRAGMRHGTRSGLWSEFAKAIDILKPRMVVIENVRGLLSAHAHRPMESDDVSVGNGGTVPVLRAAGAVLGDLADLGYDAVWATVSAASVGAPHRRERVFILATDAAQSERGGAQQQLLDSPTGAAAEPRECRGTHSACCTDAADASGVGWHQGRAESAGTVGGFDAAVRGDEPGVALLPTPRTSDTNGAGQHGDGGMDLRTTVTLLPTPTAGDGMAGGVRTVSDGSGGRRNVDWDDTTRSTGDGGASRLRDTPGLIHGSNWGKYAPAIARWEALTRPAPPPTEPNKNGNARLAADFSEWLMGWPDGWVTDPDIGISRNDQLRIVGNGVCPQQASAALRYLIAVVSSTHAPTLVAAATPQLLPTPCARDYKDGDSATYTQGGGAVSDRDEWRDDVRRTTELQRHLAVEEPRRALGITGDKDDER
jgi:DNA (cytosine-5)-methyltransferase 1